MTRPTSWVILVLLLLLPSCTLPSTLQRKRDPLRGPLLVWHNWKDPNAEILDSLFDDFMTIHPRVHIVSEYIDKGEFVDKLAEQMAVGLGPDLIIGLEIAQLQSLHEQSLLARLSETTFEEQTLLPRALNALRVDDYLLGVPFAAYTEVLYYNKKLVDNPATTFDDLIQEARTGKQIAMPTDFYHAYWGIRTFGDDILDETGNINPESGLEEWVTWLLIAQQEKMILSPDYNELHRLFATGNAAYLVGNSIALPEFRERLGQDVVGVGLLPYQQLEGDELDSAKAAGDNRRFGAGGFLDLEIMAINNRSAQKQLSYELIKFFTNRTHQRELAQYDLGQIPINLSVRFDPRFSPTQATLIRQSTDVAITSIDRVAFEQTLFTAGNDLYSQILEGVLLPDESSQMLQENLTAQETE